MPLRFLAAALFLAAPAGAQVSGCARDRNGALQCGMQTPPNQVRTAVPSRTPARRMADLDAATRQAAALQAERDKKEQEQREVSARRDAERRNCIARAGSNLAALGACPL
jgi:hypothetical protein